MGFRRYGGDVERRNLGGNEKATGVAFAFTVVLGFISYEIGSFSLFFLAVIISLSFLLLVDGFGKNREAEFKKQQYLSHAKLASVSFKEKDYAVALSHILKAAEYGELDDQLKYLQNVCEKRSN